MADGVGRRLDGGFLRLLPASLLEPRRAWLALAISAPLTLIGSLLLGVLVQTVAPGLTTPEPPPAGLPAWLIAFAYIVFAPVVETIAMALALSLLLRWLSPASAVLVSAVGWGILHSTVAPAWGLIIWWPFLIFSTLFVVWRTRGFWTGVGVATAAHMLQNLIPGLLIALR